MSKLKKVYMIIYNCRGRSTMSQTLFLTEKKAQDYCLEHNSKPDPSMGWATYYTIKEIVLND